MIKWKHAFLSLSIISFAVGFIGAGPAICVYLGLPVGLVALSLFLIFQFLEKESALYDEQNRIADLERLKSAGAALPEQDSRRKESTNPIYTAAHSH